MRKMIVGVASALLLTGTVLYAQKPAHNVSANRHPNLAEAQRLVGEAFERIKQAQSANEWDMGGHAQRAKELLNQASEELKQAALTANEKH
jgi:hypothetical protein